MLETLKLGSVIETGARYLLDPADKHEPTLVSEQGRDRRIAFLNRAADIASILGSETVSFWAGVPKPGVDHAIARGWLDEGLAEVLAHAAAKGVAMSFEPEPGMLVETVADYIRLWKRHPTLLLALDTGHCLVTQDIDPPDAVRQHVHQLGTIAVEDMKRGDHTHLPFGQGDMDMPRVLDAIEGVGFTGLVCVELSPPRSFANSKTTSSPPEHAPRGERRRPRRAPRSALALRRIAGHKPPLAMPLGRLVQVIRDRRHKGAMADASYWDARARGRSGFARSVWHSQTFSAVWTNANAPSWASRSRPRCAVWRGGAWPTSGAAPAASRAFLASRGAHATGFDFSPVTVAAAEEETRESGQTARYVVADVTSGTLPGEAGGFDAAITVGCLAVACRDIAQLDAALSAMARIVPVGGVVQLFEPIHTTRLLARLLRAPVGAWVASARRAGLALEGIRPMGFVPVRLALASFDVPPGVVEPVFRVGERALEALPFLDGAGADYRLLRFRRDA